MEEYSGTDHGTRVPAALIQHINIELAFADVTPRAAQALQNSKQK